MGMAHLIERDKLDCEWTLMTGRPTGKLGVLFFFNCLLTVKTAKKKKSLHEDLGIVFSPPSFFL